ncbi:MAG TPA: M20/M25/M40 family metallo-hydrolase [Moheibacter sp.]|nr:M20/M25/M40 family metallo-hydrolase [Moheibacter sp.]
MKSSLLILLLPLFLFAQNQKDVRQFKAISDEILLHGQAYDQLFDLTQNIGHRLSGSEAYEKATTWAMEQLQLSGADSVWLQAAEVPVWVRGEESLQMQLPDGNWRDLNFLSLGNSEGTQGKDLEAEVIMVHNMDEFAALSASEIQGKIVFFNYKFREDHVQTFFGYSEAGKYRFQTASMVAEKGGVMVVIRSISTNLRDVPHTGMMAYHPDFPKIPAVALGNLSADALEKSLLEKSKSQKVRLKLNSNCEMKGETINHNVIGELKGKKDGKIIVVGAHLDSWDVGEGAHDDGAGIVQLFEILRTFKKLGIENQHTIRFVCYANEENGVRGGVKYAEEAKRKNEIHLFAIESDAGGFSPRGFSLDMEESKRQQIQSWAPLFLPYGFYDFSGVYGGVDINPLKELMQVPVAGLVPDSQRYFDIHHSPEDTFDKINKRELHLGAIGMAQIVYMIDQYW